MPVGSTFNATITRDQVIEQAYKAVGVLGDDEVLSGSKQTDGILLLGLVVRELSDMDLFLHALQTDSLALVANTFRYTSSNNLPSDLLQLVTVKYRDNQAKDWPVDIISRDQYEAIPEKIATGDPKKVFLTEHLALASRELYVWPVLSSVNTQSEVIGTDALNYRCIKGHVADSTNRPITGANYLLYWEQGGSSGAAWATGTTYTAPQLLRITSERPIYDFDATSDNPEIPISQGFYLIYTLAARLAPSYGLSIREAAAFDRLAEQNFMRTWKKAMRKKTQQIHKKAAYF